MKDPMLKAASEALREHPDHMRWMSYADDELHRLRNLRNLPTPSGYSGGYPNYESNTSHEAARLRGQVERGMGGRFSPSDRVLVEMVLDEILAEHRDHLRGDHGHAA